MRIGVTLGHGDEVATAVTAESAGLPFVRIAALAGTETAIAATVAAATSSVRLVVDLQLGHEHPVTLAEEIAVLDNLSNGRIGVIAVLGALDPESALEDVGLLRASWSGRALAHRGRRWQVPAGHVDHDAPAAVMVTPPPAQLEVPLWVAGTSSRQVGRQLGLPVVADTVDGVDATHPVAPACGEVGGDLEEDRSGVLEWSSVGTTHLLVSLTGTASVDAIARWLVPEVAMVGFPRVVAQAPPPAPWPRATAATPVAAPG